ncbi:unnamed protein product, partial [Meganyctiphanes norvegica]
MLYADLGEEETYMELEGGKRKGSKVRFQDDVRCDDYEDVDQGITVDKILNDSEEICAGKGAVPKRRKSFHMGEGLPLKGVLPEFIPPINSTFDTEDITDIVEDNPIKNETNTDFDEYSEIERNHKEREEKMEDDTENPMRGTEEEIGDLINEGKVPDNTNGEDVIDEHYTNKDSDENKVTSASHENMEPYNKGYFDTEETEILTINRFEHHSIPLECTKPLNDSPVY